MFVQQKIKVKWWWSIWKAIEQSGRVCDSVEDTISIKGCDIQKQPEDEVSSTKVMRVVKLNALQNIYNDMKGKRVPLIWKKELLSLFIKNIGWYYKLL